MYKNIIECLFEKADWVRPRVLKLLVNMRTNYEELFFIADFYSFYNVNRPQYSLQL